MPSICTVHSFFVLALFMVTKLTSAISQPFSSNNKTNTNYPFKYLFHDMEPEPLPKSLLLLNYDVLSNICQIVDEMSPISTTVPSKARALTALSCVNKVLRDISAPALFREIIVRGNWNKAEELLDEMKNCPAIGYYAKTFKFQLDSGGSSNNKIDSPPKGLPILLANLLSSMTNLTKLVLVVPEYRASHFQTAFQDISLVLPNVKTLIVGPYSDFVLPMAPNVVTVATNGRPWLYAQRSRGDSELTTRLIEAVGKMKSVKRLEVMEDWTEALVKAVSETLPNLEYLALQDGQSYLGLKTMLNYLPSMSKLKTLIVASSGDLGIGFDGGPWCGNAYDGPDGEELLRTVQRQAKEAEVKAAGMVMRAFGPRTNLEVLWVGDTRFEFARDESGLAIDFIRHEEERREEVAGYGYA